VGREISPISVSYWWPTFLVSGTIACCIIVQEELELHSVGRPGAILVHAAMESVIFGVLAFVLIALFMISISYILMKSARQDVEGG
jgi:hypothetical protein